ncbi:tagaturonate reductase [Chitinophaga lutea]
MLLSRFTLKNINGGKAVVPGPALFALPEKVLQFGTGVLLRALADHYIDHANRQGVFNGRVVVVKSTNRGGADAFERQDSLYTLCIRGALNGRTASENIINASISRVISAQENWEQVLACAHDQSIQVIISNTTETGIQLVNDDIRRHPPASYPGKLLAFLYERFRAFGGSPVSGMVIVPAELVQDNGRKLESILLELAHLNSLPEEFIDWLERYNKICNSLVDRIVPGLPAEPALSELEKELGYRDELLCMAEPYSLWAIEGDERVRETLNFAAVNEAVAIVPDISRYRELKFRLLNGTHTLSCGLAFLSGTDTVCQAMNDERLSGFIETMMLQELVPAIPYAIERPVAEQFARSLGDRFRNPHIRHQWINITAQYSAKMKARCLPMLLRHYELYNEPPMHFATGYAAYLLFMRGRMHDGRYFGERHGVPYEIVDDMAPVFAQRWAELSPEGVVQATMSDKVYWETNLSLLPGWKQAVTDALVRMTGAGVRGALS